ncbi:M3 family oligoendopeptidase [Bacillus aerius]|uniref:M3 family oligoendopeptidase n=1 Tax=Bacillus aerius TaxID=293388 RepID=UPI0028149B15|nr:M3 family oligoendopeptidase [Bacillus aerius]WMT29600.1 M3 family oligoendopeptidase [Bacillus aerius]
MGLKPLQETWDLDAFFNGGSSSRELITYLQHIQQLLDELRQKVDAFSKEDTQIENKLTAVLETYEITYKKLAQAGSFVSCLQSQNTKDMRAGSLRGSIAKLEAELGTILAGFDQSLAEIPISQWEELMDSAAFSDVRYILNERREHVKDQLPVEQETLIQKLAVDGYHAWDELYSSLVNKITIPFEQNGETQMISVGQAENAMDDSDREVRKAVYHNLEHAWTQDEHLFASTLNHLAGFRLQVYETRGWDHILKEPLDICRMKQETLDTMWSVIDEHKQPFIDYLQRKADMLGVDKLSWFDVGAPIGSETNTYSYQDAAAFIIKHFAGFGKELAAFTEKAFNERWVEAENRPNKRVGGFCTNFPDSGESRIFMTFSGTPSNVATLAHELGHSFHQEVMQDVRMLNRKYAMNVAETASTFAEMIVADASLKEAANEEERLSLLEDKLQRSVAFFMNIQSRFLFEQRFYEERKQGEVSADRLNELMVEAQKEAFGDSLDEYHPHFWASKLHFHITGVPFYNFPYTFGYMFSLGIYAKALQAGASFEEKYIALLKDTASMTVEDLAYKHLGVDLTQKAFWEEAISLAVADAEEFLEATKE